MAELYENPKHYVTEGGNVSDSANGAPPSLERLLADLSPEEREEAMQYITAAPTGEEIMKAMQQKNSQGELMNMTIEQYRLYKAHNKTKEVDVIAGIGEAASTVFDDISKAAGSIVDDPLDAVKKLTPSVVEAFAQGTRAMYGMAAQSADPNSIFFRMKNALQANGDDEESEYRQFMEAQAFNIHSMRLMTGQDTIIVDKDIINPEMTQVMSYIADPTFFVPFGGLAAKGATMIGMGEKLAMAAARTQGIKNLVMGGAIKWGVGAPLEFMGGAIRNTIDYGIDTGSRVFETATGVAAKDIASAARVGSLGTAAGSVAGLEINSSLATASRYYAGSLIARNVGETISLYGDQMMKQGKTGRGVLGYAGQAIRDSERAGIKLAPHTKALLKAIEAVDPLFVYADDIASGAAQGSIIGGGLGYLAGSEEGFAAGIGTGMALGAVGATAGKVIQDVTGNTKIDQMRIQRKLIIEALKEQGNDNAIGFEAMAAMAEATGDRQFQGYIDGIIAGIDTVNPDAVFKAFSKVEYDIHLRGKGIDPRTGVLIERSRIFPELNDRRVKADVLGILRDTGGNFAGDPAGFEQAIKSNPAYAKLKLLYNKLDDNAKQVILKQIKDNGDPAFTKSLKGRQLNAHWSDMAYAEKATEIVNTLNQKNANSVPAKVAELLKAETRSDKKLTRRGQMLKEKLQADGYIDRDGNVRQRRLKDVEGDQYEFDSSAGWTKRRDSTGRTEVVINLDKWAKDTGNRLSLAHELYHSIMLDSVFKPDYIDRLSQKLLGKFDPKTGRILEQALVQPNELMKFFSRYIDNDPNNRGDAETIKRKKEELKKSIDDYRTRGTANRVADDTAIPLEHLVEEFGAYYFSKWVKAQPIDYMFRGGEFNGIRGLMEMASDGWLDYWKGKVGEKNPQFDFDSMGVSAVSKAFERDGKRVSSRSLDLFMRDIVRIEANRNSNNGFDVNKLSKESREWFLKVNGLRGAAFGQLDQQGNVKKPKLRRYTAEEIRQGKEMFKVLESLPDAAHKDGMRRDGDGNWSGQPNTAQINALVGAGYIQRAWFDRMTKAYDIVNGNGSNVVEFGYLGYSAHIGDGNERVYGAAVPFKNRRTVLIGVDFKVRADGTVYSNLHTLDLKVIEARGNEVWKDPQTRELWKGSRTNMEADFYAYLSNASLPSGHPNRKPSARLLDNSDGLGGQRRDALHQMLGFHKGSDMPYINRPISEIPVGIRHSVTTFSNDGIVNMRVDNKPRYDFNFENAHLDLSRNFMPDEMRQETTPSGGKIIKHATGYQISKQAGTKFKVFDPEGKHLGDFDTVADAGRAAQKHFNESYDKTVEGVDPAVPRTEIPLSRRAYIEKEHSNALWQHLSNKSAEFKDGLFSALDAWINTYGKWKEEGRNYSVGTINLIGNTQIIESIKRAFEENSKIPPSEFLHGLEIAIDGESSFGRQVWKNKSNEVLSILGQNYDAMYPMEIKSALHGQLAQIFQDYPQITAKALIGKIQKYGSLNKARLMQEATEIGLIALLESKTKATKIKKETHKVFDKATQRLTGEVRTVDTPYQYEPFMDIQEILDFAKSKEIRVTIEEGAREHSGINTSTFTLGGAKDNYKETAVRINPEYAHGIRGHYGENTIVHFRTTERIDADGNRHLFIEEVQANNTDRKSGQTEADTRKLKRDVASLPVLERILQEGISRGLFIKFYDNQGVYQNGHQSSVRVFFQSLELKQQYGELRKVFLENRETLVRFLGDSALDTAGLIIDTHFYKAVDDHYTHIINDANIIKTLEKEIFRFQGMDSKKIFVEQSKIYIEEARNRILNSDKDIVTSFRNIILGVRTQNLLKTPPANSKIPAMANVVLSIPELKEYFNAAKELALKISDFYEFLENSRTYEVAGLETYAMNPHHLEATISDIKTRIQQSKAVVTPLPLTSAKDWSLTALKGIIRQAIRDGLNKITLTHPDDSPTVSHMAGDSRKSLYGEIIPQLWGSWLKKYGIEIKQSNSMADSTLAQAKNRVAEVSSKIHDANKKVLERFEQVGSSENPEVINALSTILATPVHQYDGELMNHSSLASKVNDVQLQNGIREVLLLKQTELNNYNDVLRLQEETVAKQNGVSSTGQSPDKAVNARISAEAIDRGFTFELNDHIKREFLEGRITTHSMPAEDGQGGRTYDQQGKQWKTGFIGRQSQERPELTDGVSLQHIDKGNGVNKLVFTDNSGSESKNIGHITWGKFGGISINIEPYYRGRDLSYLFYSEAAERMRAQGIKQSISTIVNQKAIPVKIREFIFGDTRRFIQQGEGKPISQAEAKAIIAVMQKEGGIFAGVTVGNKIDPKAYYMPAEGEQGGRTYTDAQFKNEFIGRVAAENPDLTEGLRVMATHNVLKLIDEKGKVIGELSTSSNPTQDMIARSVESEIIPSYRGMGYGKLLYSEFMERLRSQGISEFRGQIADDKNRPVKIRESIAGNTMYEVYDTVTKKYIFLKVGDERLSQYRYKNTYNVKNTLDPKAYYMPAEGEQGGRTYTPEQMNREFIGRYASENKGITKGVKVAYGVVHGRMGQEAVVLMKSGEMIGRLTWMTDKQYTDKPSSDIAVEIQPEHQGKGYQHLLYSEAYERMRANGTTSTYQDVYNKDGVPVKSQIKILGKDAGTFTDRNFKQKKLTYASFMREMKYALKNGDESVSTEARLDPKAHYMPAEGEQGEPIRLSGKKKIISTKRVSTNQYEMGEGDRTYDTDSRQWTNGFIGRYAEENPILTKGIKLSMKNWDKRTDDYGKRSIELKEGDKLIGRIDYEVKKGSGGKWLLSDPAVRVWEKYRGKGYSNLLYSEMAERARFLGAEDFLQRIENDQALPMFAQVKTFGFGESKLIDADRGQYFPPTMENFYKLKKPLIDIQKQDGSVETMEGYEPWVNSWSKIFSERHYMPAEYQGGDDYYKPRKNIFGSRDDQGFKVRSFVYFDEKTRRYIKNPEFLNWLDIGHGSDDKKASMWYLDDNNGKIERANVSEYKTHESLFNDISEEHFIKGRIEYPVYKNGKLIKRGRVSISEPVPSLRDAPDVKELKSIKAKVAHSYGLKIDDIDAFYFGQDEGVKNAFGYGAKDQLPIKFMPAEGEGIIPDIDFDALIRKEKEKQKNAYRGKQYTPEQMTFSFIGRYASERQDFIKGLDLMYSGSGTARSLILSDSNTGERIGYINLIADPESTNRHAYIQMSDVVRQGRGYGTLLYSELAERLRSEGYTLIDGKVVDSVGRPIKIRKTVIDTENKRLRKKGTSVVGERVSSPLYPKAHYMPAEYQGGDDYYKPRKNIFEYKDEQGLLVRRASVGNDEFTGNKEARGSKLNPDYVGWEDIGHYPQTGETKADNVWEAKNSGLWYWKNDKGIKTKNPMGDSDNPAFTHADWFDRAFQYEDDKPTIYGRYEKPKYNKKGDLIEKGRISISSNYRGEVKDMADAFFYKETVASTLGVPADHIDAYLFSANAKMKSQMGYGAKDQLPIKFMPAEGVNAPVNEANRNFILDTITGNDNSRRALEEGMKQAKDRKQNFITIDNINPDLLRGEAVVMHSPDNAGVEPVQIGRFTVNPRGGMRFPSENPTLGWAGVKAGLGKQINENGKYNADKGYGWASAVGLIKGEYSKMKGTHIGLEVFLRNLQLYVDNKVLTEQQTIQILKNGLGDIGDTKRPLDTIVEGILAESAKHEAPYTIVGRRKAVEKMTETDGSASLWMYLQSDLTKLEPQVSGFSSEGVTNAKQFIKALLEPMYEAVSDPLTRHAKVGEVYGYLMFRSPVIEPLSDVHPSYKYAVQPEKGGSPVQLDILSTPMSARKAFTNRITKGVVSPLPESEAGFKVSTGQQQIPTMRGTFMPAEYTEFKSEQTATGRVLRNAKGYVIMLVNNKFRVYNPYFAIIGVYGNEEEAKKRIYKDIPKQ